VTSPPNGIWRMPERPVCPGRYQEVPNVSGHLEDEALIETSGIVASPSQPGVLWMHNDSGHPPVLYAAGHDGRALLRLNLPVELIDAEDIAAAPCPDRSGPCLWIGDIGDNNRGRDQIVVHALTEPLVDVGGTLREEEPARVWSFPLTYPSGARDSEALVVTPDGSTLFLFEKVDGPEASVYRAQLPLSEQEATALEEVARIASPGVAIPLGRMITAADLHPSGERLVLRTYTGLFEAELADAQDVARLDERTLSTVTLGPFTERQGEAVAYDETGYGLWSVSEDVDGNPGQPLHSYLCL
jgi:hypothetical protein